MAEFKVDEFANDPDNNVLELVNKDQLIALGKHLWFSVKKAQRKNGIFIIIYQKYIDEGVSQELDDAASTDSVTNFEETERVKDRELERER